MESDSTVVIEACSGEQTWWGESSAVYAECVYLVTVISCVQFKHCLREANEATYELARVCCSDKFFCNRDDKPPRFILAKLLFKINKTSIVALAKAESSSLMG
jgi:hypothetical protein